MSIDAWLRFNKYRYLDGSRERIRPPVTTIFNYLDCLINEEPYRETDSYWQVEQEYRKGQFAYMSSLDIETVQRVKKRQKDKRIDGREYFSDAGVIEKLDHFSWQRKEYLRKQKDQMAQYNEERRRRTKEKKQAAYKERVIRQSHQEEIDMNNRKAKVLMNRAWWMYNTKQISYEKLIELLQTYQGGERKNEEEIYME